ncbi:MAG TPA: arsenate reductase family protein [Clostridiaceae bacterium]|nr:arsenate reductase family protein [Clostridiaceae bacterium]
MEGTIYCYGRCTTCKKALKWLSDNNIVLDNRSIVDETPNIDTLKAAWQKSGLPLRRFFNTSGKKYRELGLSKKLKDMPEEEQLELLATDGMLIKRPLVITEEGVLLGFKEDKWESFFG